VAATTGSGTGVGVISGAGTIGVTWGTAGAGTSATGAAAAAGTGVGVDVSTGLISAGCGMLTSGAVPNVGGGAPTVLSAGIDDVSMLVRGGRFIFKLSSEGRLTPGGRFSGGRFKLEKSGRGAIPETGGMLRGGMFVDITGGIAKFTRGAIDGSPRLGSVVLADVRPAALVTVVFSGTVVGSVGMDIPKLPGSKLVLVACGADSGAP